MAERITELTFELQWGRAFVGAEMPCTHVVTSYCPLLQWGRAFVGAEILTSSGRSTRCWSLQWGRAFVGAEMSQLMSLRTTARSRFNGAAPLWARRSQGKQASGTVNVQASMGPRLCGRGDSAR